MNETSAPHFLARWRSAFSRAREKRVVRWGVDALFFIAVIGVAGAFQTRRHLGAGAAPQATLSLLSGGELSFTSLRGKPTLLAFWAPWCGVCKVESQNISWAMHLAGGAANVLSVASDFQDVGAVRGFVQAHEVDYPVLLGDEETSRRFSVDAFPTIYFLDAEGRVKGSAVGYTSTLGLLARLLL